MTPETPLEKLRNQLAVIQLTGDAVKKGIIAPEKAEQKITKAVSNSVEIIRGMELKKLFVARSA